MKYFFSSIIIFFILTQNSCSQPNKDINGYWLQEGYGVYLEISDSIYKMYDITKVSCQPSVSGSINNWTDRLDVLLDLYTIEALSDESMTLKYGITSYKFNRLKEPLAICNSPITFSNDPKLNFDIFWHTFKENYAYSDLRGVDWDTIYAKHKPLISEKTTDVELFGFMAEILDAIHDEHISLRVPDSITNAYLAVRVSSNQQENDPSLKDETPVVEKKVNYTDPRSQAMAKVEKLFTDTKFKSYHKDLMRWGKLSEAIGYIQINSMNGYSKDVIIPDSLSSKDYWNHHWKNVFGAIEKGKTLGQYLKNEVSSAKLIQKTILSEFSNTKGIIIDLRFNPGGTDIVALELLSSFTNKSKKAFTKKVWIEDSNNFESIVYIPESSYDYTGNIVVLTSSQTGSSAEAFVLASRVLPNITQVGSNTMGIFSDVLQKKLPNGWAYGLSNEVYETGDGKNYEYTGIPADYKIEYSKDWYRFHASIIELKDHDPAIEMAISKLIE